MDTQPAGYTYAICGVRDIPNRRSKGFHLLRREPDGTETPWHILVVRWDRKLYGYVNRCPHQGVNLDWERNQFLDPSGARLICGKHGALFEVETGECVEGPCCSERLEPVRLCVLDGDVCVTGVVLAEADEEGAASAGAGS
jgi:nitrite reductase/ring-hydroxylating ferredoxin subunit